jgi:O-antigen/teichoic acid export membrane protein
VQLVMLGTAGVAPYLTDLWGRGRRESAIVSARWLLGLQLLFCCLVAMTLTLLNGELLGLAFGSEYRDNDNVLPILSVGLIALAVSAPNHLLQLATDARSNRTFTVVGVFLLFLLALLLIPAVGLPGAALGRSTTMLAVAMGTGIVAARQLGSRLVSARNLIVALLPVLAAIAFVTFRPDFDLFPRTLLLAGLVLLLARSLRDDNGELIILSVARETDIVEHGRLVDEEKRADAAL